MRNIFKFFYLFLFIFFLNIQTSYAELLKPNRIYKPIDVVKIQLKSLKNNDEPYENYGIKQTWEFAHPSNRKLTGPLPRFIKLLNDDNYNILLNHIEHKIVEILASEEKSIFEVTILDKNKYFFKYKWQVEKFMKQGSLKHCWLTTSVSTPQSLGSSI